MHEPGPPAPLGITSSPCSPMPAKQECSLPQRAGVSIGEPDVPALDDARQRRPPLRLLLSPGLSECLARRSTDQWSSSKGGMRAPPAITSASARPHKAEGRRVGGMRCCAVRTQRFLWLRSASTARRCPVRRANTQCERQAACIYVDLMWTCTDASPGHRPYTSVHGLSLRTFARSPRGWRWRDDEEREREAS